MYKPRSVFPQISITGVDGGDWELKKNDATYKLLIAYRGHHCPVCKTYLQQLDKMVKQFSERNVELVPFSSDTKEKAQQTIDEWELKSLRLYYGLSIEAARELGLFISRGIKEGEPEWFIEPGVFIVSPDGTLYAEFIQSMPFARPPLNELLGALDFIQKNNYPARGEA
ncbi:MAG: redoxin domain-containing protein [Spirochaetia bacterium]|nr:redoxin domain-containing protein [Spirochaetia bacterium]